MKIIQFIAITALFLVTRFAFAWSVVGQPDFISGAQIGFSSMAIDATGTPYLVYTDENKNRALTVMKYDSCSKKWIAVGTPGFAQGVKYPSIAVDSARTPYVAYTESVYNGLVLAQYNSATMQWDIDSAMASHLPGTVNEKLAFKAGVIPHMIYQVKSTPYSQSGTFEISKSGSTWGLTMISIERHYSDDLHLTSTYPDTPNLNAAFIDISDNNKLNVMTDLNHWHEISSDSLPNKVSGVSLAVDNKSNSYIAYIKDGNAYVATSVAEHAWSPIGKSFSIGAASALYLVIDNTNTPWLAYSPDNKQLWVKRFDATTGTWLDEGSPVASDIILSDIFFGKSSDSLYLGYKHCVSPSNCAMNMVTKIIGSA